MGRSYYALTKLQTVCVTNTNPWLICLAQGNIHSQNVKVKQVILIFWNTGEGFPHRNQHIISQKVTIKLPQLNLVPNWRMNLETFKDYHIDGLHLNKRQLIEYQCFLYDDYCLQVTTTLTIYIYIYRPSGCQSATSAINDHVGLAPSYSTFSITPSPSQTMAYYQYPTPIYHIHISVKSKSNKNLKLTTLKSLSKLPICWNHVVTGHSLSITGGDLEWETLSIHVVIALPVLAPVPWHGLPSCLRPFDGHRMDVSCTSNVADQHQVEVRVSIDGKPYSSFLHTGDSVYTNTNQVNYISSSSGFWAENKA